MNTESLRDYLRCEWDRGEYICAKFYGGDVTISRGDITDWILEDTALVTRVCSAENTESELEEITRELVLKSIKNDYSEIKKTLTGDNPLAWNG